VLHWVD